MEEKTEIQLLHKKTFRLWGAVGRALVYDFDKQCLKLPWIDEEQQLLETADELLGINCYAI